MDKQWFVTVGVPGGDYAVKSATQGYAENVFANIFFDIVWPHYNAQEINLTESERIQCRAKDMQSAICTQHGKPFDAQNVMIVRPAPPDLVEWLEAEFEWSGYADRVKVAGGWLCMREGDAGAPETLCFVPVRSAPGITVIPDG